MVRFLSTELSVHVSVPVSLCVHDITWHIRCSSYWWRVSHRRWRRMQAAEPPPAHKRSPLHGRARPSNVHTTAAHEPAPAKNTEALRRSLQLSSKLNYSTQLMLATPHPTPPHLRTYSPILLSLSLPHFQPLLFSPWILLLTLSIKGKDFQSLITSTRKETWRTRRQTDGRKDGRTDVFFPSLTRVSDTRVCFSMGWPGSGVMNSFQYRWGERLAVRLQFHFGDTSEWWDTVVGSVFIQGFFLLVCLFSPFFHCIPGTGKGQTGQNVIKHSYSQNSFSHTHTEIDCSFLCEGCVMKQLLFKKK